jgi:predicted PurR-regulated permease PerM
MRIAEPLQHKQHLLWQVGLVTLAMIGAVGAAWLLTLVWSRLVPVFETLVLAVLLAILTAPLVALLPRSIPRSLAVALALFLVLALFAFLAALLVPLLRSELSYLAQNLPDLLTTFEQGLQELGQLPVLLAGGLGQALRGLLSFSLSLGGGLVRLMFFGVLTCLAAFYLTRDGGHLRDWFFRQIQRHRPSLTNILFTALLETLWRYFRAVILVSFLGGLTTALGCWALGVPYPWLLGLAVFFGNFIPYLGPIACFALGLALCLGQPGSITLSFILVFAGVSILVNYVYSPLVLSNQMNIQPLWVMIAVLGGVTLFGFWGAILAVPILAMAQTTRRFLNQNRSFEIQENADSHHV